MSDRPTTAKQAISVTLGVDNLEWLKGRAEAGGVRSVSELLDQIVTAARQTDRVGPPRSIVGTIGIAASDPMLDGADGALRALFEAPLGRPLRARPKKRDA